MELLNTQFDEQFEKLKPLGLKFLPWVGADYEKSETKILIVGDSHYVEGEDDKEIEKK